MSSSYPSDIRVFRRTKLESKADWLSWRKGKFSATELDSIKQGLNLWVAEQEGTSTRDELLESLKWARDNKLTAWCDIATKVALPDRKIGAIRHCILRRYMPGCEIDRWTAKQTAEFVELQSEFGPRAWKKIAQATGRSLEDVVNKGRQMNQVRKPTQMRFTKSDNLQLKIAKLVHDGHESSPYEYHAIRSDCMLVSLIRKYNQLESVHEIPGRKIARKLGSTCDAVRLRWHQKILPLVEHRVTFMLNDSETMDAFLVVQLLKACRGELGFPVSDWNGIDFRLIAPLWSQTTTQNRLKQILRRQPKFDLLPLVELAKLSAVDIVDHMKVYEKAKMHFTEITRIITLLADRGDTYLAE